MCNLLKYYRIKYKTTDPVHGKCFLLLFFPIPYKNVLINSPHGAHIIFTIFGEMVKFEKSV